MFEGLFILRIDLARDGVVLEVALRDFVGHDAAVLPQRDTGLYCTGVKAPFADTLASEDLPDDAEAIPLIEDHEAAAVTEFLALLAEEPNPEAMKGAHPHLGGLSTAGETFESVAHLPGGLIGKAHGQDGVGSRAPFDQTRNSVRDYTGLTAACPGENEQRPMVVLDGFSLGWVQWGGHGLARIPTAGSPIQPPKAPGSEILSPTVPNLAALASAGDAATTFRYTDPNYIESTPLDAE
jgi:hypothetical protein